MAALEAALEAVHSRVRFASAAAEAETILQTLENEMYTRQEETGPGKRRVRMPRSLFLSSLDAVGGANVAAGVLRAGVAARAVPRAERVLAMMISEDMMMMQDEARNGARAAMKKLGIDVHDRETQCAERMWHQQLHEEAMDGKEEEEEEVGGGGLRRRAVRIEYATPSSTAMVMKSRKRESDAGEGGGATWKETACSMAHLRHLSASDVQRIVSLHCTHVATIGSSRGGDAIAESIELLTAAMRLHASDRKAQRLTRGVLDAVHDDAIAPLLRETRLRDVFHAGAEMMSGDENGNDSTHSNGNENHEAVVAWVGYSSAALLDTGSMGLVHVAPVGISTAPSRRAWTVGEHAAWAHGNRWTSRDTERLIDCAYALELASGAHLLDEQDDEDALALEPPSLVFGPEMETYALSGNPMRAHSRDASDHSGEDAYAYLEGMVATAQHIATMHSRLAAARRGATGMSNGSVGGAGAGDADRDGEHTGSRAGTERGWRGGDAWESACEVQCLQHFGLAAWMRAVRRRLRPLQMDVQDDVRIENTFRDPGERLETHEAENAADGIALVHVCRWGISAMVSEAMQRGEMTTMMNVESEDAQSIGSDCLVIVAHALRDLVFLLRGSVAVSSSYSTMPMTMPMTTCDDVPRGNLTLAEVLGDFASSTDPRYWTVADGTHTGDNADVSSSRYDATNAGGRDALKRHRQLPNSIHRMDVDNGAADRTPSNAALASACTELLHGASAIVQCEQALHTSSAARSEVMLFYRRMYAIVHRLLLEIGVAAFRLQGNVDTAKAKHALQTAMPWRCIGALTTRGIHHADDAARLALLLELEHIASERRDEAAACVSYTAIALWASTASSTSCSAKKNFDSEDAQRALMLLVDENVPPKSHEPKLSSMTLAEVAMLVVLTRLAAARVGARPTTSRRSPGVRHSTTSALVHAIAWLVQRGADGSVLRSAGSVAILRALSSPDDACSLRHVCGEDDGDDVAIPFSSVDGRVEAWKSQCRSDEAWDVTVATLGQRARAGAYGCGGAEQQVDVTLPGELEEDVEHAVAMMTFVAAVIKSNDGPDSNTDGRSTMLIHHVLRLVTGIAAYDGLHRQRTLTADGAWTDHIDKLRSTLRDAFLPALIEFRRSCTETENSRKELGVLVVRCRLLSNELGAVPPLLGARGGATAAARGGRSDCGGGGVGGGIAGALLGAPGDAGYESDVFEPSDYSEYSSEYAKDSDVQEDAARSERRKKKKKKTSMESAETMKERRTKNRARRR